MPNQITSAGLETKTLTEIVATIVSGFQAIYGSDVNVEQNSPDGQLINIFGQSVVDLLELLTDVYNSMSVENAYGTLLDQRIALNGIARKAGTFTFTDIDVTVDRALTLAGLDTAIDDPDGDGYTIEDNAGNQFILAETHVFAAPGTETLSFRAKPIGATETTPNTITNQVTVTLGVTSVNNPGAATSVGLNEETDVALKIRHAASFSLAATGPADAIQSALEAIPSVTDAFVAENNTAAEVDLVPAHGIWCIVEGGTDAEVGQAIYSKKMPGCAMKGSVSNTVDRPNGTTFIAKFDRPILEDLYIKFDIVPKSAGVTFDTDLLKTQLAAALVYKLNQSATIGDVIVAMLTLAPLGLLSDVGISDDGLAYVSVLAPTDFQHKFVTDATRIDITA